MKNFFSMMLLMAAVMVSAFTSCKSDDEVQGGTNAAKELEGIYSGKMTFYNNDPEKGLINIGQKDVAVRVVAQGNDKVNIEIPMIENLSFEAEKRGVKMNITVKMYSGYTVKDVYAYVKGNNYFATTEKPNGELEKVPSGEDKFGSHLDNFGFAFQNIDVEFNMDLGFGETGVKLGQVSGEVSFDKNNDGYSLLYRFRPVSGIEIYGKLGK